MNVLRLGLSAVLACSAVACSTNKGDAAKSEKGGACCMEQAGAAKPAEGECCMDTATAEAGFVPLFNGKDLTGWVYGDKGGKTSLTGKGYQVADGGILYCTKEDGGNLLTDKDYADFIVRFDFKLEANANNGLGIHAPLEGDVAYKGIELQILDDTGSQYTALKPWQFHGSVYGCVAAKTGSLKPVGEWNSQEVVVKGKAIKVTLNGNVIVDTDLDKDVTDPEVIAKHPGLARTTGRIGFLGHGTRVEFKNIQVKELKS